MSLTIKEFEINELRAKTGVAQRPLGPQGPWKIHSPNENRKFL